MDVILIEGDPDWRIRLGAELRVRTGDEQMLAQLYVDKRQIAGRFDGVDTSLDPSRLRRHRELHVTVADTKMDLATTRQRPAAKFTREGKRPGIFARYSDLVVNDT